MYKMSKQAFFLNVVPEDNMAATYDNTTPNNSESRLGGNISRKWHNPRWHQHNLLPETFGVGSHVQVHNEQVFLITLLFIYVPWNLDTEQSDGWRGKCDTKDYTEQSKENVCQKIFDK
jgi:hypothetical protein